jgi:hypothetical protein
MTTVRSRSSQTSAELRDIGRVRITHVKRRGELVHEYVARAREERPHLLAIATVVRGVVVRT